MANERVVISTGELLRWTMAGLAVLLGLGLYFWYAPRTPEIFAPPAQEASR